MYQETSYSPGDWGGGVQSSQVSSRHVDQETFYSPGDWGGGVQSSQVVDMCTKRILIHLVTGVEVYRAHK